MEHNEWLIVKKVLDVSILIVMLILTLKFLSKNICFFMAAVGNVFFMTGLILGDPLQSGIKLRTGEENRSTFQFFLVAGLIWAFSAMFHFTNMCGIFADIIRNFGKAFIGLG